MYAPHLRFTFGDYSPRFSTYTLSNTNINGFYGKMDFKYFRLMTVIGNSKRAIEGKVDVTENSHVIEKPSTFERDAFGMRMEVGKKEGLNFGLSFVKSRDDLESLNEKYYKSSIPEIAGENDEEVYEDFLKAVDNLVTGVDVKWNLLRNRLSFGAEAAMTYYNSNINNGYLSEEELKEDFNVDAPVDPESFENIYIFNMNSEPFMPGLGNIAYKVYGRAYFNKNLLNISFNQVGSVFNSLTSSSGTRDTRKFSITDSWLLWKNRINLSVGATFSSDNISEQKNYTTKSVNWFMNTAFNIDELPYLRFSISPFKLDSDAKKLSDREIDETSYWNEQYNGRMSVTTGYEIYQLEYAPSDLSISFTTQSSERNSQTKIDSSFVDQVRDSASNTIGFKLVSKFRDYPIKTTLGFSTTSKETISPLNALSYKEEDSNNMFSFRIDSYLMDNKLKPYVGFRTQSFEDEYFMRYSDDEDDYEIQKYTGNSTYFYIGSSYNIFSSTTISSSINLTSFKEEADAEYPTLKFMSDKSTFRWNLNVSHRF